jgi:hypothetical protein
MGVLERIEYDPNCSSWIVLVQWIEGVLCFKNHFAFFKTINATNNAPSKMQNNNH